MRSFEICRVVENKQIVLDENGNEVFIENARLPEYSSPKSAGADFFSCEEVVIPSIWKQFVKNIGITEIHTILFHPERSVLARKIQPTLVKTGIKSSMYDDEVLELYNRSSNPIKIGLVLANGVGVIDADYYNNEDNDGNIMFAFYNFFPWDLTIKVGDKLGQGVFKKFLRPEKGCIIRSDIRKGGIGSTDK